MDSGFSLMLRTALLMANRTFVRLGALKGACAALCKAAAVCIAGYYAQVKPAVRAGCARPGACAALRNRIRDALPARRAVSRRRWRRTP